MRRRANGLDALVRGLRRAVLAVVALLCLIAAAPAAERSEVTVEDAGTYGRVVIDFPALNLLPKHTIRSTNGVLVLQFDDPVDMDVGRVPVVLGRYVTIARGDPDGRGARLALGRSVRVNTMEAGGKLFIDFMPGTWTGPPPRLPDEVVADLARKADEATKQAREAEILRRAGGAKPQLTLRAARNPTFTRLVFTWNLPFKADFRRGETSVVLTFDRRAPVDLGPLQADMPPFLEDISAEEADDGGLAFRLVVQPVADVRAFREGDSYMVDIQGAVDPSALSPTDGAMRAAAGIEPAVGTERVAAPGEMPHDAADAGHAAPSPAGDHAAAAEHGAATDHGAAAEHGAAADHAPAADQAAATDHGAAADHGGTTDHGAATDHGATADHGDATDHGAPTTAATDAGHGEADGPAVDAAADEMTGPKPKPPAVVTRTPPAPPPAEEAATTAEPDAGPRRMVDAVIRPEAKRIGRATRIVLPYRSQVGSALFTRGPALWLVVDDPAEIDLDPLREALAGIATSIEPITVDGGRAMRILLTEPLLATLNADGTYWVVTIGDVVMEPTRPLPIKRSVRENGLSALDVPFGRVSSIHRFADPAIGDELIVVTGLAPARGLIKPQSFVEVEALSSAHGLAFVPLADDLAVTASDAMVSIERPEGLSVTTSVPSQRASLIHMPSTFGANPDDRPGYVDFGGLEADSPADYWKDRHELGAAIAQSKTREERVANWYRFAEFMLANQLAPETLGALDFITSFAEAERASQRMAMLRAAASVLAHRPKDAVDLLDRPEFAESPDAAIWKTIALAELGDYPSARQAFPRADAVVGSYPKSIQTRFLLAGIAAAIELNDFGKAKSLMAELDQDRLTKNDIASLDLLNARAADATGHTTEAIDLLSKAVQTSSGPVEAEATYRLVNLQRREGLITLDQAADRLEQLAVSWRGDDIELKTLRTLAQVSVAREDYRRAFELMRVANLVGPESDTTRMMQEEMQAAFSSLFLDGKAKDMPPVDALALYYDFRELTPNGRRGDEMVRHLADRLVSVDLLPQAAELLTYQVDNRLRGAAKAKVAADLALIYLLDKRPDRALLTLSRSRQAELPVAIERQRRIVEAKALSDTGKADLGLELLKPLAGAEIERLQAEILWTAGRYRESGEGFERLLGGRWADATPFGQREQLDVMRAGIAYVLAEDQLSIDRLRSKFAAKMAATPNDGPFKIITDPVEGTGTAFNDVALKIAAEDSRNGFLQDYRDRYLTGSGDDRPIIVQPIGSGPDVPEDGAAPTDRLIAPSADTRSGPVLTAG